MLTPEEVARYQETGQVTPKFRLSDDVVSDIRERMEAFFESRPDLDPDYTDSLIEADKVWLDYARIPDIVDAVSQLLGDNLLVWGAEFFCKQASCGKATPWHQDGFYWPVRPLEACSVWIAIDHSTPANGCMRIIPGSHNERHMYRHDVDDVTPQVLKQTLSPADMPDIEPVDVVLEPGMISFHDVYTMHGAERNNSGDRRAGLVFRYIPTTSHYDRELAKELGGLVANPVRELHLVRGVDVCGLNDVWQPNA